MSGIILFSILLLCIFNFSCNIKNGNNKPQPQTQQILSSIVLPNPVNDGPISVEKAISNRRSIRSYKSNQILLKDLAQLLWAAQGITSPPRLRTTPSAGALYPVEIYVVVTDVENLESGVYKYFPTNHSIGLISKTNIRNELFLNSLSQSAISNAPATFVISLVFERVTQKYKERGIRYSYIEAGCVAQNIYLQSESLKIGTVIIGAFDDEKIKGLLGMLENESPAILMPFGYK